MVLLVACFVGMHDAAAALDEADQAGTRMVIERQLEAFRHDDAASAYGFASPAIQGMFPSPDAFMDMVRRGYAPIIGPRRVEFGPLREGENGVERAVSLQDANGVDWDAVYSLERQGDGAWRISGCRLVRRPGESA